MTGFIFASISEFITCLFEYCLTRCRKNWLVDPTLFGRYPIAIPCAARKKSVITFITILSQFSQPAASFFNSQFLKYFEKKTSAWKKQRFFSTWKNLPFLGGKKRYQADTSILLLHWPRPNREMTNGETKRQKHLQLTRRNLVTNWTVLSP